MSDLLSSDTLAAASPVVKEALDLFGPTIDRNARGIAKSVRDKTVAALKLGFRPYLDSSYDRCKSVKTLLSQDKPLNLLDIYVNLQLLCREDGLTDDALIEGLEKYRLLIITGLAGCGKSMFMKYLTVCRFERTQGKIPLFTELRQLNSLTSKTLITYIYQSCATAKTRVTFDQFELALRAGAFLLIPDGFDEIEFAHRDAIAQQILELSTKYPEAIIVVSSRPDDRFAAWQSFYTFAVQPLDKEQVLELIDKIDYDPPLKKRFKTEVDGRLYRSHKSFLSSPLLCSIMLLTYEQFAEIPTKMHIFYEQAFSALFWRHDASKAQFIRKTYADLAVDDLTRFFSAFCVFSYLEERFAFLDDNLQQLVARALKYARVVAKIEDLLRDLHECLCMLQKDGIHTVFVHRSFQEYFCAVFLVTYNGPQLRPMLNKFAQRSSDQVIPMLFEMARDKVDQEWVIPRIEAIIGSEPLDDRRSARIFDSLLQMVACRIELEGDQIQVTLWQAGSAEQFPETELICKLYRSTFVKAYRGIRPGVFEIFGDLGVATAIRQILIHEFSGRRAEMRDIERALRSIGRLKKEKIDGREGRSGRN